MAIGARYSEPDEYAAGVEFRRYVLLVYLHIWQLYFSCERDGITKCLRV